MFFLFQCVLLILCYFRCSLKAFKVNIFFVNNVHSMSQCNEQILVYLVRLRYAEVKHSDWLMLVSCLATSNQSGLFLNCITMLKSLDVIRDQYCKTIFASIELP